MSDKRRFSIVLPHDSDWTPEDINNKADNMGLSRNEFIVKAIDIFMNFDKEFLDYIKYYAEGLQIPEYLVIQNMVIVRMADEEAQKEVYGDLGGMVEGFLSTIDKKGPRQITGKELKDILKDKYTREYKNQLEEVEAKRKGFLGDRE